MQKFRGGAEESSETVAVAAQAATSALFATLVLDSDWQQGYVARVVLTNSSSVEVTNWFVTLDLNDSTISSFWNGSFATSGGLTTITAPSGYNQSVPANGALTLGFQGSKTGTNYVPQIVSVGSSTPEPGTGGAPGSGGASTGEGGSAGEGAGGAVVEAGAAGEEGSGGSSPTVNSGQVSIELSVPNDVWLSEVVLCASTSVVVGNGARIEAAAQVPSPVLAAAGEQQSELKGLSSVADVYAAGVVRGESGAEIRGLLVAPETSFQEGVSVGVWESASPTFRTLRRTISVPELPTAMVWVNQSESVHLAPGNYGGYSVRSGGSLSLEPGRYFFRSLEIEPGGWLNTASGTGTTFAYVAGSFMFRGLQLTHPGRQLVATVLGEQQVLLEDSFTGAVIAPQSQLVIGSVAGDLYEGQFFARSIEVRSGTRIGLGTFPEGIDDDGDPCVWEQVSPGGTCDADIACSGASVRRCIESTCQCDPGPGVNIDDGCSSYETTESGQLVLGYEPANSSCSPAYACDGPSLCNGRGYCLCQTDTPVNDCTLEDPENPGWIRPVSDGLACSSFSGSCVVTPTCSAGLCSCGQVELPPGTNADCVEYGSSKPCIAADCVTGTCNDAHQCICPELPPMVESHPIRLGTQNVAALPFFVIVNDIVDWIGTTFAGCGETYPDLACQARHMVPKLRESPYDFIALNEAFDDPDYRPAMVDGVTANDGPGRPFPYVIERLDVRTNVLGGCINSGLMLLSRWPFAPRDPAVASCFAGDSPDIDLRLPASEVEFEEVGELGLAGGKIFLPTHTYAVDFEVYEDSLGPDSWGNKGVGYARLAAPHGRFVNVFFTHLQATDAAMMRQIHDNSDFRKYWKSHRVRQRQLEQVNRVIECVMSHYTGPNEVAVLMGDLNISGDLSNPWAAEPPRDPSDLGWTEPDYTEYPLWKLALETRNEWDYHFNWRPEPGTTPALDAARLRDTWAYAMTPQCVADSTQPHPPEECWSLEAPKQILNSADELKLQEGEVGFDRGATWCGSTTSEERLDYVLLSQAANPEESPTSAQHISRAHNLFDGKVGLSVFSRDVSNTLAGGTGLSDHFGLNAELDDWAPYMNPASAIDVEVTVRGQAELVAGRSHSVGWIQNRFPYATGVHWYRVDTPGDYAFAVNPRKHGKRGFSEGPDNGLHFQVFEATDLSRPIPPYNGEIVEVPPTEAICAGTEPDHACIAYASTPGFRSGKYRPLNFPLYVKVFASDPEALERSHGGYVFYVKRMTCASAAEACERSPFERLLEENAEDAQVRFDEVRTQEVWYSFTLERPDTDFWPQALEFLVAEPAANDDIDSIAILADDGTTVLSEIQFQKGERHLEEDDYSTWTYTETGSGPLTWSLRDPNVGPPVPMTGKKFFLRVLMKPGFKQGEVLVSWTTTLTWLYGPQLGGDHCLLHVEDTQEVGCDEIYVNLLVCNTEHDTHCAGYPRFGGSEAKDMAHFDGSFNETAEKDWTQPLFVDLVERGLTHPDGTSFSALPAIGFTHDFWLKVFEDDRHDDEVETAVWKGKDFPRLSRFRSGRRTLTFPDIDDGVYKVKPCNLKRFLAIDPCNDNSDCNPELACIGGVCREQP